MRKPLLISFLLILIALRSSAQISLTQSDIVGIGDMAISARDTSTAFISPGNAGSSPQNWSFSFIDFSIDTSYYVDPAGKPGCGFFPASNLAVTSTAGNYFSYLSLTSTLLSQLGDYSFDTSSSHVDLPSPPVKLLTLPSTYNTTFSGTYTIELDRYFDGTDSTKDVEICNYNSIIDAFGNITTPSYTNVSCLRQKLSAVYTFQVYRKTNGVGNWVQTNTFNFTNSVYYWWTKQQKQPVCSIFFDDLGHHQGSNYLKSYSHTTSIEEISYSNSIVYPNPSSGKLQLQNIEKDAKVLVYDVFGRLIMDTVADDGGLFIENKGIYLIKTIDSKGRSESSKVIIE